VLPHRETKAWKENELVAAALNSLESRTIKVLLGDFIKPSSIVGYSNMRFFRFLAGWLVG